MAKFSFSLFSLLHQLWTKADPSASAGGADANNNSSTVPPIPPFSKEYLEALTGEDGDDEEDGGSDGASASIDVLRPVGPRLWLGAEEREDPATDPEFRQAVSGKKRKFRSILWEMSSVTENSLTFLLYLPTSSVPSSFQFALCSVWIVS